MAHHVSFLHRMMTVPGLDLVGPPFFRIAVHGSALGSRSVGRGCLKSLLLVTVELFLEDGILVPVGTAAPSSPSNFLAVCQLWSVVPPHLPVYSPQKPPSTYQLVVYITKLPPFPIFISN